MARQSDVLCKHKFNDCCCSISNNHSFQHIPPALSSHFSPLNQTLSIDESILCIITLLTPDFRTILLNSQVFFFHCTFPSSSFLVIHYAAFTIQENIQKDGIQRKLVYNSPTGGIASHFTFILSKSIDR